MPSADRARRNALLTHIHPGARVQAKWEGHTMKKPFELPEIATYKQDELVIETVFAGGASFDISDRNLKENFRSISSKNALARLIRLL
jgi:hypothetical protein